MEVSSEMELKRSVHDAMRTEGTLSANSEAIGEISSVPILSYASLRRIIPGLGTRWAVPFCSLQPRCFADIKNSETVHICLLVSIQTTS